MKKISILILWLFLWVSLGWTRVYINIDAPGQERMPIAISTFISKGDPQLGLRAQTILKKDLDYTGLFSILSPETFLEEKPTLEVDFKKWQLIGAYLLIKGKTEVKNDLVYLELVLYDVRKGLQLLGKRYKGAPRDIRYMVHKFADAMMEVLTGEPGIFQTKIAFVYASKTRKEIYLADFDGYHPRALTRFRSICLSPKWHPKGDKLLFTSYKRGKPDVYLVDLKQRKAIRLIHYPGLNIAPAWSPTGDKIAVTLSKTGKQGIYLVDNKGKIIKPLVLSSGINVSPAWSPDGGKLAFVSDRSGSPQIYVLDLSSNRIERLTFEGHYNTSPAWSPKGDFIVYSGLKGGHFQLFMIKSDGGIIKQLTYNNTNHESPSWSPDGHFIVFSQDGKICILRLGDGEIFPIVDLPGKQTQPSWSPRLNK
ncbi:MAG: Tol-Pal system beta propeller repeat protein TolB [Candidatus Desulfofervidaceae bacterium]|nr:Tol-Pal system beta propeller repeat protein TolB [Candidatus Desulfofervidaceae bacterium]